MGIVKIEDSVVIGCRDGNFFEITANKSELPLLLLQIQRYSPDLVLGYGDKQMKQYETIVGEFKGKSTEMQ